MEEIKSCNCNNNDTIDIIKADSFKVSILCAAVENSLNTSITIRSELGG